VIVLYKAVSDEWKLADFGFATEGSSNVCLPSSKQRGTTGYRAPELLQEHPIYTVKVDIWAVGCVFFEIVTGRKAFRDDWEAKNHVTSGKEVLIPDDLDLQYPALRQFFSRMIHETLSTDWDQRPSADDLRALVEHVKTELSLLRTGSTMIVSATESRIPASPRRSHASNRPHPYRPPCTNCRRQKRKVRATNILLMLLCVFDESRLVCNSCLGKELQCSLRDETLQVQFISSRKINPSPIVSQDEGYMNFFHDVLCIPFIEEMASSDDPYLSQCLLQRFSTELSSNCVRYAVLFYSSSCKDLVTSNLNGYRDRCCREIGDAVDRDAHHELVYACYFTCLAMFIAGRPFGEIASHTKQFLVSFRRIQDILSIDELFLMRCMTKDLLCWMSYRFGAEPRGSELAFRGRARELYQLAELTDFVFKHETRAEEEPTWMKEVNQYTHAQLLACRLQRFFEYTLMIGDPTIEEASCAASLTSILDQLRILFWQNPKLFDLASSVDTWYNSDERFQFPGAFHEGLLWEPSLLAYYRFQFALYLVPQEKGIAQLDKPFVETGIEVHRIVTRIQRQGHALKMTDLGALPSLMAIGFLLAQGLDSEGNSGVFVL